MLSRQPSMRAIAAFEAAARHESFAAAGKELNLTQSAISHSIRGLEAQIGAQLFLRRGPNLELTSQGRALAERLRLGLVMLSEALVGVAGSPAEERLVVGTCSAYAERILLPRWRAISARHSALQIDLRTGLSGQALQHGDLDLAISLGGPQAAGLATRILGRDRVFPVIAAARRAEAARFPDLELIENALHPWSLWFHHLRAPSVVRAPSLSTSDWGVALRAAREGLGVALACESLVAEDLRRGELVRIGAQDMPCQAAFVAAWRLGGPRQASVEAFLDLLTAPDEALSDRAEDQAGAGLMHVRG